MPPTTRSQAAKSIPKPLPTFRLPSPAEPPVYQVDLTAPPRVRYREICANYKAHIKELLPIYDELLGFTPFPRLLNVLAKCFLRRVHSSEENEEIKGISDVTGLPKHLVIAYNTFLDLLSGCSSGGVRVNDAGSGGGQHGIVHFRGLDWDMEPLRKLIICVEYVRDGKVEARAVTYAGYIGVLTGVRQGLSLSLNYRPRLNSPSSTMAHRFHQTSLLLGLRPSISSMLRKILLSPSPPPSLSSLARQLPKKPSTPCYLTFCTPSSILILDKDLVSAKSQTSDTFLAVTNHDFEMEGWTPEQWRAMLHKEGLAEDGVGGLVRGVLEDSIERKACVAEMCERRDGDGGVTMPTAMTVTELLEKRPVLNESTHFSCVMDPAAEGGGLVWVRAYEERVDMDSRSDATSSGSLVTG